MAGGIDDLDIMGIPPAGGYGRGDGDAAFLFVRHPIHYGFAIVNLADLVGATGVKEDTFRHGGFTGIDMGNDTDVSDFIDLSFFTHWKCNVTCKFFGLCIS